jgi:polyisoprenoid-binding protein YceI
MRIEPSRAQCRVFTYKEGLLSAVAHDLEISVNRFTLELADDLSRVEATFDPRSLRVEHSLHDGERRAVAERDRRTIEGNITDDVLEVRRYPDLRFVSSSIARNRDRATITGSLTLHGRTRPLTVEAALEGGRWRARVRLHQPDFGIKPYSAMLGTLRIQPDITVELTLEPI